MEKDLEGFIENRCEEALQKDGEYVKLQKKLSEAFRNKDIEQYCEISLKMQGVIELTSYRLACKDLYSVIKDD